VPRVSVAPTPVQRPGPPIHLVGISEETLLFGAERGLPLLLAAAQPESEIARTVDAYRRRLKAAGHDPDAVALLLNRFVYVADTTDAARAQMAPAIADFLDRPGSVIRDFLGARAADMGERMLFDEVFICGDAEHCAQRIERLCGTLGLDQVLLTFNYFTLPHERCLESMRRFAEHSLPLLSREAIPAR
jgi:alkanesulfonate monooxygenase SsuD/methylene tetrahydromethanopterin reductase-like flavin-dependent oxidoreductase (luciferase family)